MGDFGLLSLLIFLPLAGALAVALLPRGNAPLLRGGALVFGLANLALSLRLFDLPEGGAMGFVEHIPWIERFGIAYALGVDGIAAPLIALACLIVPIVVATTKHVGDTLKEYLVLLLLMEVGMVGVFAATDLVLFFVFFELTLVPLYFLIGIWGGERRIYAAFKFFLFTAAGSLPMLISILYLLLHHHDVTGVWSAATADLVRVPPPQTAQLWCFLGFAAAFAIKVPMFPLHTWLPDAHVQAPTGGSIILAGIMLKLGSYGFVRYALPLMPEAARQCAPWLLLLAMIGVIYGSYLAWAQNDLKKLVACSSVAHMGFVMVGIFSFEENAMRGAVLQMLNHGISTGALFFLVGAIYERRHKRGLDDFGGLAKIAPAFSVALLITSMSSIGLPGLNGFVGEYLIILGTFQVLPWTAVITSLGILLGAIYMLQMVRRVCYGKPTSAEAEHIEDMTLGEKLAFLPLLALMFWIGLAPGFLIDRIGPAVDLVLKPIAGS